MNIKTFRALMLYGIFGVLTTILNILTYWVITRIFGLSVITSTVIAWVIAVLFAYITNRKYVFHSRNSSIIAVFFEAVYFFGCRVATGILDVAIMYLFADLMAFNDVITKTVSNIIVIILNYIASRMFIFTDKEGLR
ncbi:MAG: GtrA family protein [Synergistaceae bacterium]|nr:GtrA family protein [Synergistaceae bacterium]